MARLAGWNSTYTVVRCAVVICWLVTVSALASGCYQSFGRPPDAECVSDLDCAEGHRCAASGACICVEEPCACSPLSCAGCCAGDLCLEGSADDACGNGGDPCRDCSSAGWHCIVGACVEPEPCEEPCPAGYLCDDSGSCVCDVHACDGCCSQDMTECLDACADDEECRDGMCASRCGMECAFGTICSDEGICICDPSTCPGCCTELECYNGDDDILCGRAGQECRNCVDADMICSAGACALDPACGEGCIEGTRCVPGVGCRCDESSSCDGCCSEEGRTCYSGNADTACGIDGGTCDRCTSGMYCDEGSCACSPARCRLTGGCCSVDLALCQHSCWDDEFCRGGLCTAPCGDGECDAGYFCVRDFCALICLADSDCPPGLECFVNVCLPSCVERCVEDERFCYMGSVYECTERSSDCLFPTFVEDCDHADWCLDGACRVDCGGFLCDVGEVCLDGTCVRSCLRNSDCPDETPVCHDGVCECAASLCEPAGTTGCLADYLRYTCGYAHAGDVCRSPILESCMRTTECTPDGICSHDDRYCIAGACDLAAVWTSEDAEITDETGVYTCVVSPSPEYAVEDVVVGDVDGDGNAEVLSAAREVLSIYDPDDRDCSFIGAYIGEADLRIVAVMLVDLDSDGVLEIVIGGENRVGAVIRYLELVFAEVPWILEATFFGGWAVGETIEHLEIHPDENMVRGCEGDRLRCFCVSYEGLGIDVCPSG